MRTLCALIVATTFAVAADNPSPKPGKAIPEDTPLEATLKGTTTYTLDLGGKTAEEFAEGLKADRTPPSPKVELKLILKNTSEKDVQVWVSGDPMTISFTLKGKGVETAKPRLMFTREFRVPKVTTVPAGETVELPIKSLTGGFRGASEFNYWTQPGEYQLVATLTTGMSPAPEGAADAGEGFGQVKVASKPLKITVEAKK